MDFFFAPDHRRFDCSRPSAKSFRYLERAKPRGDDASEITNDSERLSPTVRNVSLEQAESEHASLTRARSPSVYPENHPAQGKSIKRR